MVVTTFEPIRTKLDAVCSLSSHNDRLFGLRGKFLDLKIEDLVDAHEKSTEVLR